MKDKEFSFVLKDADGNEIETVKNDKDGNVTFSALSYDKTKVGTHNYTVEEVIPALPMGEGKGEGPALSSFSPSFLVKKKGYSLSNIP